MQKSNSNSPRTTTQQQQQLSNQIHLAPSPLNGPPIRICRSVDVYEKLNRIDEGSYGIVYRARNRETGEIVALKKLKLEKEQNGFPITTLREIYTLLLAKHPNIVDVKEIVVTPSYQGVFIVMEFLLSAVDCLHSKWIVHRDLKTSNLLMNNRGMMKVADFGLARRFGDPAGHMTQLVVTLWYRAPELLLGAKEYTTAIDMWSVGCIFAELVNKEPLAPGRGEIDQLDKFFKLLGTPSEKTWPGFTQLPHAKSFNFKHQPFNNLKLRFPSLTANGIDLMERLLTFDPKQRITAAEALKHPYFTESPAPKDPSLFPTVNSPGVPYAVHGGDDEEVGDDQPTGNMNYATMQSTGFRLKFM
ncbi:putative cell division cycle 2 [Rhizoclosmatium globosum]|uniref:Putative cell division cycle 2 n=1 Tax=Rhizoclosmatium globosum TaxID=329046 RepID=A0A1Y2BWN0_9FUNG|nr:putative cell division cycle 2 [Rhizoclosmatium globosum]|eukprot:ORY38525.1 putative cell division cycle 2 [Rhizoclosmatium globosum]